MKYIRYKKQIGFTLLELMMVVVIAGVLISIGIPSYNVLRNNNCLVTNANRLVATLQYARSEAAKRNRDVSVRARSAAGCTAACTDRSWRLGFEIITDEDADGDGTCTVEEDFRNSTNGGDTAPGVCEDDQVLKVIELGCGDEDTTRGLQVSNTAVSDVGDQALTYRSSGRINNLALGGVFEICMAGFIGEDRGRETRVSSIGRPQTNSIDIATCPF